MTKCKSYKDLNKEDVERIIKLYESGLSQVKVGKEIRVSDDTVRRVLKEYGIHIRTNREQALKYTCNENFLII